MPAKKKAETTTPAKEKVDNHPLASGEVSLAALKVGARDNDSVRRLQYALDKAHRGQVRPTGNYQARTASLVATAVGDGDGSRLTKAQAQKILGSGYTVTE